MRYLSLAEILDLHEKIILSSGGSRGVRDLDALESALCQAHAVFDGKDLHPDIISKASALCFSLIMNHPFVDGNKRIGHAAMETFLILNGCKLTAPIDEQENLILGMAAGKLDRTHFADWLKSHITKVCSVRGKPRR